MSFYSIEVNPISAPPAALALRNSSDRKGELYFNTSSENLNEEINLPALADLFPKAAFANRLSSKLYESETPIFKMKSFEENAILSLDKSSDDKGSIQKDNLYPKVKIIKQPADLPVYINDEPINIISGKKDTLNIDSILKNIGFDKGEAALVFDNVNDTNFDYQYSHETKELIINSDEAADTNRLIANVWSLNEINKLQHTKLKLNLVPAIEEIEIPVMFELSQNYPNPFNPSTNIQFALPKDSKVKLVVYNILGQIVEEIVNGEMIAGYYKLDWTPSNLASGVFIYRIETQSVEGENFSSTKKMMFVK
jgi:hypothetical protein